MRKEIVKELYTYFTVHGDLDAIKAMYKDNFSSYSNGKASIRKYHDTLVTWLQEILKNEVKCGFGIRFLSEDNSRVTIHNNLDLSSYLAEYNKQEENIKILNDMINHYYNINEYYYIEDDPIYMTKEFTGHTYYNSPYESCDNCGTCDGAKCDYCRTMYKVYDTSTNEVYYFGPSELTANEIYNNKKKSYKEIISDIMLNYDIDMDWYNANIDGDDIKNLFKLINQYKIPYCN